MITNIHICPVCEKEFKARSNKVYCGNDCKSSFNNSKASDLRKELFDNKILKKNYLILKELHQVSKGQVPIDIKIFYSKGFDFLAPTRKVKTPKNGFVYYLINNYAFRTTDKEGQSLIVNQKEDLENL
jgi:hypothetical protein